MHDNRKNILVDIITDALQEMDPYNVITRQVEFNAATPSVKIAGKSIPLDPGRKIWVLGSGKASAAMGLALEELLGDTIEDGLIITPKGTHRDLAFIQLFEGSHPIPDRYSLAATYELIDFARKIPEGDLVFYLISGGTSSLLCMPAGSLELEELADTYQILLRSGANIYEINTVRSVLSEVKGGQLLKHLGHTTLIDLIISDVPGDDPRTIGSGPTSPDHLDYGLAYRILEKYEILAHVPHAIRTHIAEGVVNHKTLTIPPHPGKHFQFLLSTASRLAREAARQCKKHGYRTYIHSPAYNLAIADTESLILKKIDEFSQVNTVNPNRDESTGQPDSGQESHQKQSLIFFGESTVNVRGGGKGGRNQELALRIARYLSPGRHITFASVGTDGVDGPTDAAGAVVDENTVTDAINMKLNPDLYLEENDSYNFFRKAGGHIKPGPTGNNLMDLQIVLLG